MEWTTNYVLSQIFTLILLTFSCRSAIISWRSGHGSEPPPSKKAFLTTAERFYLLKSLCKCPVYPAGSKFLKLDAEIVPALSGGDEKVHFNKNVNV